MNDNHYHILGVSPLDSEEAIRRAYRERVTLNHPDHADNDDDRKLRTENTRLLNDAYTLLRDPVRRAAYDLRLRRQRHGLIDADSAPRSFATDMFGQWAIRNRVGQLASLAIIVTTIAITLRIADVVEYSPIAELVAATCWLLLLVVENGIAGSPLSVLERALPRRRR